MRKLLLLLLPAAFLTLTSAGPGKNFIVHLGGEEEVPPVPTRATGEVHFRLYADGLHYKLIVANIDNVIAAHIHFAPVGQNGPVVAFLFGPVAPGGGRSDGAIAEGVIKDSGVIGPIPQTLAELVDQMRAGNCYVNVHTSDGVDPPNTGPGDFASGEIRGQIRGPGR
jgi:hypothetical protein